MTTTDYFPLADVIRERVSVQDAAQKLGIAFGRDGRCKCLFCGSRRKDTLRLYPGNRGYYCFSCHASGDVIKFWREMTADSFRDAVKNINEAFGLGLQTENADPDAMLRAREETERRRKETEEKKRKERRLFEAYLDACDAVRMCEIVLTDERPKGPDEAFSARYEAAAKNVDLMREYRERLAVRAIRKTE